MFNFCHIFIFSLNRFKLQMLLLCLSSTLIQTYTLLSWSAQHPGEMLPPWLRHWIKEKGWGLGVQAIGDEGVGNSVDWRSPIALRRSWSLDTQGVKADTLQTLNTKRRREPENAELTGVAFFCPMSYFSSLTYIDIDRRSGVIIKLLFTCLVCLCGRAPQDIKEVAPGVHYQNSNECVWKTE